MGFTGIGLVGPNALGPAGVNTQDSLRVVPSPVPPSLSPTAAFVPVRHRDHFPSLGMGPGFHLDLSELWGGVSGGREVGTSPGMEQLAPTQTPVHLYNPERVGT